METGETLKALEILHKYIAGKMGAAEWSKYNSDAPRDDYDRGYVYGEAGAYSDALNKIITMENVVWRENEAANAPKQDATPSSGSSPQAEPRVLTRVCWFNDSMIDLDEFHMHEYLNDGWVVKHEQMFFDEPNRLNWYVVRFERVVQGSQS